MKRKITVSIGIPAYNEENNISNLIEDIYSQGMTEINLDKVIVVSDGSTDKTVEILKKKNKKNFQVVDRKIRIGGMETQNEILKYIDSDILILLDADIRIPNKDFIKNLILPIKKNNSVGIVGADTFSLKPYGIFEKVIAMSHEYKKNIYKKINNGNNVYMCHGRARAFSKTIYKKIKWPNHSPEDAYSYFFTISKNKKFVYSNKSKIYFRSPTNFNDHLKQSLRFVKSKSLLSKYFDQKLVSDEYLIPKKYLFSTTIESLISSHIYMIFYLGTYFFINIFYRGIKIELSKWENSPSTKVTI